MTFKAVKATACISAALLIAASTFGKPGDVLKRADNGRLRAASTRTAKSVANPKKTIFAKLMPMHQEPGSAGNTPKSKTDVYWECILPKGTGVPKKY